MVPIVPNLISAKPPSHAGDSAAEAMFAVE
jgi:hypothetical protein